ncbi:MAG: NAD(P)/FAD-dependent oxidoreductase [Actinobacteria bacterium]|nr:NAD(P)/FAD-dependent oxidoreductase [Actinomycetota bacterium]
MAQHEYDVVVLGGGSTGENVAWYAIDNGLTAAVVESELVGGECTYWACMPSKALLRPGEALAAARRVPGAATAITGEVDVDRTLHSRDAFAARWDDKYQVRWMDSIGAALYRGQGRLAGERHVEVTGDDGERTTLTARRAVVVATGSRAATPPVEGLHDIRTWDNRDVTSAKQVPQRLLVMGGGVVGVEMAQAWKRLGAHEVTVIELFDRILAREEPFASELVRSALEAEGITVLTDVRTVRARRDGDSGPVTLTLADGSELVGDELLVATGRRANTEDIGLDTVGLEAGGDLETDDQLRVDGVVGDWLYAAGDVNGRALLTHQGKYQARLVGDLIAGRDRRDWADTHAIPRVVFTDPQVAAVGLTCAQARDQNIVFRTAEVELGGVAGAALLGEDVTGRAQLVIDDARDTIVGATFVCPGAGEMLHAATIAIVSGITIDRLWHAVPAFPTVSEVWLRLLEADRGIS